MKFLLLRGNLSIVDIDNLVNETILESIPLSYRRNQENRDGHAGFHITVIHRSEIDTMPTELLDENIPENAVCPLGLGQVENEVFFIIVFSAYLQQVRNKYIKDVKLQPKDFHITLGFRTNDIHNKGKGITTLIPPYIEPNKQVMQSLLDNSWKTIQNLENVQPILSILKGVLITFDQNSKMKQSRILDAICALLIYLKEYSESLSYSEQLIQISEAKGYLRKCEALKMLNEPISANSAGLKALLLFPDTQDNEKPLKFLRKLLSSIAESSDIPVDSRCLLEQQYNNGKNFNKKSESIWTELSSKERKQLVERIQKEFPKQDWELNPDFATNRRCCLLEDGKVYGMPRNLSWIIPQKLCSSSTPRSSEDIAVLSKYLGISLVISFTLESPLPEEWFQNKCQHLFLPFDNYKAPSFEQVDEFLAACIVSMVRGGSILVHCGGGKGRAGTMLACWLIRMGVEEFKPKEKPILCVDCCSTTEGPFRQEIFCQNEGCGLTRENAYKLLKKEKWNHETCYSAKEAIQNLRIWRPGSIETQTQEDFIHQYSSLLWKWENLMNEESEGTTIPPPLLKIEHHENAPKWATSNEPLQVEYSKIPKSKKIPSLILSIGLPGSGKSTFATSLLNSNKVGAVISGDELGGREAVEKAIGNAIKSHSSVFVDRCHVDATSRAISLSMAFHPEDACCIFFDLEKDECIRRASARINHPVIAHGGGMREIESFVKKLQPPKCSEGFAKIYTIRSKRAVYELLSEFGVEEKKSKEEINPQVNQSKTITTKNHDGPDRLPGFFKFPRTPHLCRMGEKSVSRDDLLISDSEGWLALNKKYTITVEEKIDGANCGITIDPETQQLRVQNRSHYVSSGDHPQFSPLNEWLSIHSFEVRDLLDSAQNVVEGTTTAALFGEWVVAKHSIPYNAIPDYFVAFDILLANGKFASRKVFYELIQNLAPSIATVPQLFSSKTDNITMDLLRETVTKGKSKFRSDSGNLEGVYIRIDEVDGNFLKERSKIVRADFIAGNDHWSKHTIERNTKKH